MTASNTLCAAKWAEGTIWLYQGTTANCHHNPFHTITLTDKIDSIYNTPQKEQERADMLKGKRPAGCEYCWAVEDRGQVSDRTFKTHKLKPVNYTKPAVPQILEIAFERTCNLACAYCGPAFSSKWANEIKKNGPYDLLSDSRYNVVPAIFPEDNPYVDAFFKWWPELKGTLNVLRITGGEPLMSPNFWKFLDMLDGFKGTLIVNSNLISHKDEIQRLLEKTSNINLRIHTSIESNFKQAEYVRDGFETDVWMNNVYKILDTKRVPIHLSTAINNMSVWSFEDYIMTAIHLKKLYSNVEISCNLVHYPKFMNIDLIPYFYQHAIAERIVTAYEPFSGLFNDTEKEHITRLTNLLKSANIKEKDTTLLQDLKKFIVEYDQRRNKNYKEYLDEGFIDWYGKL